MSESYSSCNNCGISVEKAMLHRTKPMGQSGMGLMCLPCIEKLHPELAKNIQEDMVNEPILKDLEDIFYPKKRD